MWAERDGEDVDDRWSLHASDRTLLGNKTGATRLGFAILLKMFQANGRFPYRLEEVPVAAVEAIASQIRSGRCSSADIWPSSQRARAPKESFAAAGNRKHGLLYIRPGSRLRVMGAAHRCLARRQTACVAWPKLRASRRREVS